LSDDIIDPKTARLDSANLIDIKDLRKERKQIEGEKE